MDRGQIKSKLDTWILPLLLLLCFPKIRSGQLQPHTESVTVEDNKDNMDNDLSMLFSTNTFCKFIFNGPEEDNESKPITSKMERNIRSVLTKESEMAMAIHNNRHHNRHRNHVESTISLNQTIMGLNVNQVPFSNKRRDVEQEFPPNLEESLSFDANPKINSGTPIAKQEILSSFDNLSRKQKNKKNHYNHYSYSPPSDSHPVYIGLEIIDVDRINDAENYFSLQLYLFEMWHEPRLNTTALKQYWARNSDPIPVLEANIADCLWTPSLVFEDSTEKEHLLPPTNILLAHHNKVLLRKSRYSLKVRCHMNLQIYPMDKHSCHFKLRAFTDPIRKVVLKWLSDPGSPKPDLLDKQQNQVIFSPEFTPSLFDIRVGPAIQLNHIWLNEQYSLLDVEFIFERRIIHSLLTVYIPSSLIVTLSWLQFWFDVEAVPGRMSLGIMSTLTIMTQILTNYEKAGNHVTAVDIWLFVCLIMVFLALMEYALAYTISHYYDTDDDDDTDDGDNELDVQSSSDVEKIKQQYCYNLVTAKSFNNPPQMLSVNQVDPLKTSSLPIEGPILKGSNKNNDKESMLTIKNDVSISDRILLAQQQIIMASQELEILLNEKYTETIGIIQSVRRSMNETQRIPMIMAEASTKPIKVDSNNNKNENIYIRQRRPLSVPNNQPIRSNKREPNRLIKFRRSLRRQLSSRNFNTGTTKGQPGVDGGRSKLSEVDYISRYLFPFFFVLFAIGYWIALIYYKLN